MEDVLKIAVTIAILTVFPMLGYGGFVAMRAWGRKMDGKTGSSAELDDLRARVAELEQMQIRVEELEERMDFSERMLTQEKQPGQLKP